MKSQLVPPLNILPKEFQLDSEKSSLMNLSYKKCNKNLNLVARTNSYFKKAWIKLITSILGLKEAISQLWDHDEDEDEDYDEGEGEQNLTLREYFQDF
jgi:hypothetical protein